MPLREDHFAIVIGIQRYPYLDKLDGAVRDAEDFRDWLIQEGGLKDTHIELVTSNSHNNPEDRPFLRDIEDAFEKTFEYARQRPLTEIKRLYVYFAGHGCCSEDFKHVALLMANATTEKLGYSANATGYHVMLAHQAVFLEQVFFYDCCRNYDRRVRGADPPWHAFQEPSPATKDVVQYPLYGSSSRQSAYERSQGGPIARGLFTRALLEGLRGRACIRKGSLSVVTTHSLGDYVYKRLKHLADEEGVDQQPFHNPAGPPADLTLAEFSELTFKLKVRFRAPDTEQMVEIKNEKLTTVEVVKLHDKREPFSLPWGTYFLRTVPGGRESYIDSHKVGPEEEIVVDFLGSPG